MSDISERPTIINDFGCNSFVMHTTGLKERLEKCTMTEQQEKILAVLDMSYDEQWEWLEKKYGGGAFHSFESLAWGLRDEVISSPKLYSAMLDIHQKAEGPQERSQDYVFWAMRAKPIHWILAALIAKAKESNNDNE